ncbi:hypothetical protein Bca4012_095029 [Brassica carinata]
MRRNFYMIQSKGYTSELEELDSRYLSQQAYATYIIKCTGMEDCKLLATPVDLQSKLSADDGDRIPDPTQYRRLANMPLYARSESSTSTCSQEDLQSKLCAPNMPLYARSESSTSTCSQEDHSLPSRNQDSRPTAHKKLDHELGCLLRR